MREAIEKLIEDYERRSKSAVEIMEHVDTHRDQKQRVKGKYEAYQGFIRELKEVLANADTQNQ